MAHLQPGQSCRRLDGLRRGAAVQAPARRKGARRSGHGCGIRRFRPAAGVENQRRRQQRYLLRSEGGAGVRLGVEYRRRNAGAGQPGRRRPFRPHASGRGDVRPDRRIRNLAPQSGRLLESGPHPEAGGEGDFPTQRNHNRTSRYEQPRMATDDRPEQMERGRQIQRRGFREIPARQNSPAGPFRRSGLPEHKNQAARPGGY